MELIDAADFKPEKEPMPEYYRNFVESEGIPVHGGFHVEDLRALDTGYWERTEQAGAFVNLYGTDGVVDLHIHELEPGGETSVQQHLYEEIVYVLGGSGITAIGDDVDQQVFEWNEHSLFFIPHDTPYTFINTSDTEPARLVSQTPLPQYTNMIQDVSVIFSSGRRRSGQVVDEGFYSGRGESNRMYQGKYEGDDGPVGWEANFIPDISTFDKLDSWNKMGAMKVVVIPPFPRSTTQAHLSEIPVGTYKKAHRHMPGSHVFIRTGETGYSLLWKPEWEERKIKVEWKPGSVFTPPAYWYHHHFNLGTQPAGQLAMHAPRIGTLREYGIFDAHIPENIIEYADEDPEIRSHYESELDERDIDFDMPDECYVDPEYDFGAQAT